MEKPLIKFNPKLPKLSKNEQSVLKLLVEAAELIAPIYQQQEKQIQVKVNKKELEIAAKRNPNLLSPYTIIEKSNGKLVAIPYHIKYAKLLKPVVDKLIEASNFTENKNFANLLKIQAKALLEGTQEDAIATWLKTKPYILDISIGPVEHHDDRLFHAKASYQAWVGVLDLEATKRVEYYKQIVLSGRRKDLLPGRLENYHEVRTRVDNVVIFSGHMARTKFVGVNLPMNPKLVEKYGSEITLFTQVNDLRSKEQIWPIFNKNFSFALRQGFNFEDLRRGNFDYVTLHELAHNDLYYKNAAKNLGDLLSPIYELSANVLGLRMAGTLLLKDIIKDKQLESMIIAFICRSFYLIEKGKRSKSWINYGTGGVIFINFMLQSGALKQFKELIIPNFTKIFLSLPDLSYALEFLLSSGTRNDAKAFIKKYGI
ncbi:hypothetical protein HY384_01945 [Candidatus Daviesbacteria bacterium]|nr:hypothetical protein [Candidatus Daviesbacteria bacterium]